MEADSYVLANKVHKIEVDGFQSVHFDFMAKNTGQGKKQFIADLRLIALLILHEVYGAF